MGVQRELALPEHASVDTLANQFSDFFIDKITAIREELDTSVPLINSMRADNIFDGRHLAEFVPACSEEVREIIISSPCKSCSLDPLPTWLLKQSVDLLLPIITAIINQSLAESYVPNNLKRSNVTPLLKKQRLEKDYFNELPPSVKSTFCFETFGKSSG